MGNDIFFLTFFFAVLYIVVESGKKWRKNICHLSLENIITPLILKGELSSQLLFEKS